MRVYISLDRGASARIDAVATGLAEALKKEGLEVSTSLEFAPGENWYAQVDRAAANSEAYLFLLGPDSLNSSYLEKEWRMLLRNDFDGDTIMIPILVGAGASSVPGFLRCHWTLEAGPPDLVPRVMYFLRNPRELLDPVRVAEAEAKGARFSEEMLEYALELKKEAHAG